jgi:hypothetical protein
MAKLSQPRHRRAFVWPQQAGRPNATMESTPAFIAASKSQRRLLPKQACLPTAYKTDTHMRSSIIDHEMIAMKGPATNELAELQGAAAPNPDLPAQRCTPKGHS